MQPRNLALLGAALRDRSGQSDSSSGSLGAFFGIQMDATSTALIRLVSASYVGFGVLDWAALDLTDRAAWRVVAVGNTTGWALGGVVMATALASGLGNAIAWSMVAIQVAMTIGWLGVIAWTSHTGASRDPGMTELTPPDPPPPEPFRRSRGHATSRDACRNRDGDRSGRSVDRRGHRQSDPLLAYLQTASGPVELARLELDSPAVRELRDAGVALVVPLVSQGELIGTLNLGPRLSEQDYSTDDRRLLTTPRRRDQPRPSASRSWSASRRRKPPSASVSSRECGSRP